MSALEVSVVIPTRNRRERLERTLGTALAQRGVRHEVIVVDDGSDDGTSAWLASRADERLRVCTHAQAQGVARARNAGVAAARGRCIAFLDDDDLWSPDKLGRQLRALGASDWCLSNVVTVDPGLHVIAAGPLPDGAAIAAELPRRNTVPAGSSSVLATRAALEAVGGFDTGLRHFADWDLWIRLAASGPPATVDEPDVAYVVHAGNASADSLDAVREAERIGERTRSLRDGTALDPTWVHRWSGWWALQAGRRGDALRAYTAAVRAGDRASLARAAVALLPARARDRLLSRPIDPVVAARAEAWLAGLR